MKLHYFRVPIGAMVCALLYTTTHANGQLNETYKITASDAAAGDLFGVIAVSGTTAIVGASYNTDAGVETGSAYIFDITNGKELFKLTASDAESGDRFGYPVALSGTTAIVGARNNDDAGDDSGSAYVYNTITGNETYKLTASDAELGDGFGGAVGINGNTAVIGAPYDNDKGTFAGSIYIFDTATGDELFKLTASDTAKFDRFGADVAISGNTVIVGARQNDDAGNNSGSAYIFDTITGTELFKLTASDAAANDEFGIAVAISGTKAIIGARWNDDAGDSSGSAYIFDLTTGEELYKLTASDAAAGDWFGSSVALNGEIAVVGSPCYSDSGCISGSAYVYDIISGNEIFKLTGSDTAVGDRFGSSVAISGNTVFVGSPGSDIMGENSGSVYVFENVPDPASGGVLLVVGGIVLMCRRIGRLLYNPGLT